MSIGYTFTATDADVVIRAVTPATKVILIESPTNPLLEVIHIRHLSFSIFTGTMTVMICHLFPGHNT